jgi:hypothetical protein
MGSAGEFRVLIIGGGKYHENINAFPTLNMLTDIRYVWFVDRPWFEKGEHCSMVSIAKREARFKRLASDSPC